MSNVLLPILPGQLAPGYCFTSWQQTLLDFSNAQKAVLSGQTFFNYGDTKPEPQYQIYPWLRTTDMRWYAFSGVWKSPVNYSIYDRRLFTGTLNDLKTYDGGSATGIVGSPTAGPMWIEDEDFRDRSPIGVGPTIQSTVDTNAGSKQHTLTEAEGAVGEHVHPIGVCDPGSDDGVFPRGGVNTVPGYTGHYIVGHGTQTSPAETTANLYTLKSGQTGAGVASPSAFDIVHPVRAVYVIKWSQRAFYVVS